jgi:hypothetical protein
MIACGIARIVTLDRKTDAGRERCAFSLAQSTNHGLGFANSKRGSYGFRGKARYSSGNRELSQRKRLPTVKETRGSR